MKTLEQQLAALRKPLLSFARLHLADESVAEDAVSETLLAILEKPQAFRGSSSLRTYATAILKNKLADQFRRHYREVSLETAQDQGLDDLLSTLFDETGHWRDDPSAWIDPESVLERQQLAQVLVKCLQGLPQRLAHVLTLRELHDADTAHICSTLGITAGNCNVMLFRARLLMRSCLNLHWFDGRPT